jgi:hypothetical protein
LVVIVTQFKVTKRYALIFFMLHVTNSQQARAGPSLPVAEVAVLESYCYFISGFLPSCLGKPTPQPGRPGRKRDSGKSPASFSRCLDAVLMYITPTHNSTSHNTRLSTRHPRRSSS